MVRVATIPPDTYLGYCLTRVKGRWLGGCSGCLYLVPVTQRENPISIEALEFSCSKLGGPSLSSQTFFPLREGETMILNYFQPLAWDYYHANETDSAR